MAVGFNSSISDVNPYKNAYNPQSVSDKGRFPAQDAVGKDQGFPAGNETGVRYDKSSVLDSLVNDKTQSMLGKTVGQPQLSEKAQKYYDQLKAKFGDMDFILVSKDQKANAQANAASYANPNKMVVLIGEDEVEKMANDESFRSKYEGIIAMAKEGISAMKNQFGDSSDVKGYGMQVGDDGEVSYFAVLKKANDLAAQNTAAQQQIEQLDAQRAELELAFKKSSKHHIKLQKAMYRIEQQKQDLEHALTIINEQKSELERVNEEIKKSNQMKEIFLANTSHEIRTPLNAIIGFTNLLLKMNPNENQLNYLNNIKNSGNNLLFIINDILDLSKIEAGKMDLENTNFDIRDMVGKIVSTLGVKRDDKEINIIVDVDPRVPEIVVGDPYRITQVLTNLVNNSIKFTGSYCQIELNIRLERIVNDDVELQFRVSDNGIGIPKDKQEEIFQSFTQANKDTTRKYGGTGLGLSITKQLVEMYHGHISVESEEGQGSTFTFNLILKMADSNAIVESETEQVDAQSAKTDKRISILLVEDNEINQQLATDTIKAWNYNTQIDIANNGEVAVEKVKNGDYNLILMDIQMPIMDGNTAAKIIRQMDPPKNRIPIIAMTAHAFKEERERCFSNGMNDYVMKPFDTDDLCSKIYKYTIDINHEVNSDYTDTTVEDNDSPFNLQLLEKICDNDNAELSRIVDVYAISIPTDLADLSAACKEKDIEKIKTKTHSLKTSFSYLGMTTATNMVTNLSKLLVENPDDGALPIAHITDEWEQTIPLIKEYIKQLG